MNHWYFILGAYAVTALVVIVEIIAVRARCRAARELAGAGGTPSRPTSHTFDRPS